LFQRNTNTREIDLGAIFFLIHFFPARKKDEEDEDER
jgi:hypothetical protein